MRAFAGLCALACVCAESPLAIPAPPRIAAAFARDGFSVVSALSYGGGVGVSAESAPNVTINGDPSKRKPAYYVSGSGYEMGGGDAPPGPHTALGRRRQRYREGRKKQGRRRKGGGRGNMTRDKGGRE